MESPVHPFHQLFEQLGLPADPEAIAAFIRSHTPIPGHVQLADAAFWTPAQAAFLREELREDADWAEAVDQLNAALRSG